jgi:hypothetical protein
MRESHALVRLKYELKFIWQGEAAPPNSRNWMVPALPDWPLRCDDPGEVDRSAPTLLRADILTFGLSAEESGSIRFSICRLVEVIARASVADAATRMICSTI